MFYLDYIIDIIQAIILLDFNVLNSVGRWFVVRSVPSVLYIVG